MRACTEEELNGRDGGSDFFDESRRKGQRGRGQRERPVVSNYVYNGLNGLDARLSVPARLKSYAACVRRKGSVGLATGYDFWKAGRSTT